MSFANVGLGIVGGYVWTMEANAARLAEMTLKVAYGTRASDIPVEKRSGYADVRLASTSAVGYWRGSASAGQHHSIPRTHCVATIQVAHCRGGHRSLLQTVLIGALLVERRRAQRGAAALPAQRVLQESEERFRNMADTAPTMIWVFGPDQQCTFVNRAWLTFTGRTIEQEGGAGWLECVHPDDLDRVSRACSSAFDGRSPFQVEYRLRRADGEYRSLLCTGVPRFQKDGVFAGYIGSCLDITDLKRAQERALAGQKLELIGMLANGIAHDFNNLLGGILASTELALSELAEDVDCEEELLQIRAAAGLGAQIVREVMIFGGTDSPARARRLRATRT